MINKNIIIFSRIAALSLEISEEIAQQFAALEHELIHATLKPEMLKILHASGEQLITLDTSKLVRMADNIAEAIVTTQIRRGFWGDLFASIFQRQQIRESTARIFLFEALVSSPIRVTRIPPHSIYLEDINCTFAIALAFGQFCGPRRRRVMSEKSFIFPSNVIGAAKKYQKFAVNRQRPYSYENANAKKVIEFFRRQNS